MKKLWYRIMHAYVAIGLRLYFRKIMIRGRENIPTTGPVMFLANHQNALMDALLVATTNNRHTHFLARADLFKNRIVRWLLSTINMKPVYRIRDGWSALSQNTMTFEYCEKVLRSGDGLLLFPEGNHDLRRRVRPLSKGFTRILDHALASNPTLDIQIVPVGINYSQHQNVWSKVSIYYGSPISIKAFLDNHEMKSLREYVSEKMKLETTHIESLENYDASVSYLSKRGVDFLDPRTANRKLSEISVAPTTDTDKASSASGSVAFLIPFIFNFIPCTTWILLKRKIKDPVFVSTSRFAVAISLFPLNFIAQEILLWFYSPIYALLAGAASILSLPAYGLLQGKE